MAPISQAKPSGSSPRCRSASTTSIALVAPVAREASAWTCEEAGDEAVSECVPKARTRVSEVAPETALGSGSQLSRVDGDEQPRDQQRRHHESRRIDREGRIGPDKRDQAAREGRRQDLTSRPVDHATEFAASLCSSLVSAGITACTVGLKKVFPAASPAATT